MAVGIGCVALAAVYQLEDWAIAAVFPCAAGMALLVTRPPAFSAEFTEQGLEVSQPPVSIPFERIEGLRVKGRRLDPAKRGRRSFPINISHSEGVFKLPASLNVSSDDVYRFLCSRVPAGGSREVNGVLRPHLAEREQQFGADRIWSYRARKHLGGGFFPRRALAVFLAGLLSGAAWTTLGFATAHRPHWGGIGILALIICGFMIFVILAEAREGNKSAVKNWRKSSLVISPTGLAVVQGDDQGEMRWDELRNLKLQERDEGIQTSRSPGRGILLVMDAARFVIVDVYDRPLPIIYERIRKYWGKGREASKEGPQ